MMPPPEPEKEDATAEQFAMDKMAANANIISTCRVASAIVAGCVAGIMGIEGFSGFLMFLLSCFLTSGMLCLKMGSLSMSAYFKSSNQVWTEGLTQGLMSFILFWTLFFDLVHIY